MLINKTVVFRTNMHIVSIYQKMVSLWNIRLLVVIYKQNLIVDTFVDLSEHTVAINLDCLNMEDQIDVEAQM